jgi:hypothetical protein
LRAAGDFFAGALVTVAIFLDFWREKGAFTDPASSCNLPLCRKAEAAAPMLHAAAAAASAVELVGGQCYCCACGTYATASAIATTTTAINSATRRRRLHATDIPSASSTLCGLTKGSKLRSKSSYCVHNLHSYIPFHSKERLRS